jgi:hypothetical protein
MSCQRYPAVSGLTAVFISIDPPSAMNSSRVAAILPETLFSHGINLYEHRYESENLFKALSKIFKGAELSPGPWGS